ncbi:MAG: Ig-like domain-containing protein, partial [Pseudomonadota bacterium]
MGFWRSNFVFGTFGADELLGSDHKDTVFGFSGGDVISTFRGRDLIFAGAGNDTIDAGDGRDTVYAGSGNDEIIGSRGNDTIFGGRGLDLVTYEGSIDDYAIETLSRSRYTVTSLDMTLGDAGRDLLRQVEALYFIEDDLTLFIDGRNNVVRAGNDATETSENAVLEILADDLLANDRDFDGDALTITSVDSTSASGAQVSFVDGVIRYDPGSLFDALAEGETTIDTFTYVVDDGLDGADTATVTVTITGTNDDPVLTAPAMVSVEENSTAVTTVSAMDVDGTTVTFSLGGDDAALFAITPEGALSFIFAPDFEAPSDANQDNTYNVTVIATDEAGGTDDQAIEVIVTDVDETPPLVARINELHYDNDGTDVGEFIEIRVDKGGVVSNLIVELYNGNGGGVYTTLTVSDGTLTGDDMFDYYVLSLPANGIQNGSPDGLALSNGGALIEFLSYEGTFDGVGGAADGATSTDIGVAESGTTLIGQSLQRNDDGSWREPEDDTPGAANVQVAAPLEARINELHYDNDGTDTGEFIEVRVAAGGDVSGLIVELYNGNGGGVYSTLTVSDGSQTTDGDFDYYVLNLPSNGIQNGSPDGLALSNGEGLIEFLSYEGTFDGFGGAADGVTSTDIGVAESGSTPVGDSLQRNDDGTWRGPEANTSGAANVAPVSARINELHYDNDGTDTGEFIEIRVDAGDDVSSLLVELYNGNGGGVYGSFPVSGATMTSDGAFDYYVIALPSNGIQNGPDGVALSNGGQLIEFLSYEGTFAGVGGAADGVTSTDIGVVESNSTPIGQSLQRNADGTWRGPEANTQGADNDGAVEPPEPKLISEVQGSGDSSDFVGMAVTLSAVVTHVVSNGYYLQEEDADADADAATSEGIFVFTGDMPSVSVGNQITVSGAIAEFFGATQLTSVTSEVIDVVSVDLPTPAEIMLDPAVAQDFEAVEGMQVVVSSGTSDPLTVIENFNLDRFGDVTISAGVQTQPTQLFDAQTEANEIAALQEANANN